jgi:hypothetical protein
VRRGATLGAGRLRLSFRLRLRTMAGLLGCVRRFRARVVGPFGRLGVVTRLGTLVRLRRPLANLARLARLARLDPVRLPVGRLLGRLSDRGRVGSHLGRRLVRALSDRVVRAHRVVAAERGLALSGLRRLAAVRALRATLTRWVAALPIVAAPATPASAPASSAWRLLAVLRLLSSRLAALAVRRLRVALALPLLPR